MECFRIDESGYTGFDLLNPDQPFQGAAAIAIEDDEARRLIKTHFPDLKASELKYRALSKRPANHPRLISLMRDLLSSYKSVTYVCDKRFLLLLKFCDYAVEPWYHNRGVNIYEDGQNYSMASLMAITGPKLFGRSKFDALLATFQGAMKDKSGHSLADLVTAAQETNWDRLPEALGPLAHYAAPECLAAIATPGVSTDAAFVVLQALITRMEAMCDAPYRVEHDQSKNLTTYHGLLEQLIAHEEEIELRQSEIATLRFPLKLTEVVQVDSKSSPAVQLADVMIGAALEAIGMLTGKKAGGLDPGTLLPLYGDDQIIHLLPSLDFEEQKRFRKGTEAAEVINYFAANFSLHS